MAIEINNFIEANVKVGDIAVLKSDVLTNQGSLDKVVLMTCTTTNGNEMELTWFDENKNYCKTTMVGKKALLKYVGKILS